MRWARRWNSRSLGGSRQSTTWSAVGRSGFGRAEWTDDTSMAMCLAESLVETGGFDAADQMRRYLRWRKEGHWSSNGRCFDIGSTVGAALTQFESNGHPLAGRSDPRSAGNGSLMRLAPVPLRFAATPATAVAMAADSSKTTHGAVEAVDACRYFAGLIVGALRCEDKATLLSAAYAPDGVDWHEAPLAPRIADVAAGSFKDKPADRLRASGYVVHTLEAALWAFHHSTGFRDGALLAVNLGEDADTTGAVYGQIAGAYYGVDDIPRKWREQLARADEIRVVADRLLQQVR